ncbi:MAG: glutamyl-tRNA reductase [Chloroflexi bacterium]|nr:glutamyl-tRNA reductase [Chloroflexota bacterium]
MQYILAGLNIDHAPVDLLEKVAVQPHELRLRLEELALHAGGGVILSTCNRTEIIGASADPETGLGQLTDFLGILAERAGRSVTPPPALNGSVYHIVGDDVIRHLFRVTAGLDSLAIGEAQVAGQVSRALQAAGESGSVEPIVSRMFHAALRNSRMIRRETGLGRDSLSISSIGLQLVQQHIGDLSEKTVLVVGAGETGRLTARTLKHVGVQRILVTSRSAERARLVCEELDGEPVPFTEMASAISEADVVVACTAAMEPVVVANDVRAAMSLRPDRRLTILDVGMPRDVEHSAGDVPNVELYSLEELHSIAQEHRQSRVEAAAQADALIERAVERFKDQLVGIGAEPVIRTLGSRAEAMREIELARALGQMPDLPEGYSEILDAMSRALVKRMLADPITYLRSGVSKSAAEDVAQVFDLDLDVTD